MNSNKLFKFYLFSTIFTLILGTILHFIFELSNQNYYVGAFSAINESTWEHLKLVFYPMLITIIIGYFYLENESKKYVCAKTIGVIFAMFFITIFFFTYTGILGTNYSFINILIFILAVIFAEYITYIKIKFSGECNMHLSFFILLFLLIFFVAFTYFPPKINFFKDPINSTYGIQKSF